MIQAIIFDCFGVLYRSSADELYNRCAPDKRGALHDIRLQRDRGHLHYEEYLQATADLLDASKEEVREITESSHVRNQVLFDYIRSIDRNKFKVGMLSNIGDTTVNQLFSDEELHELFDATVLSYEVGMIKPDPAIFRLMAARLGVSEDTCVMIDDGENNCVGAQDVGMSAVHFTTNEEVLAQLGELTSA